MVFAIAKNVALGDCQHVAMQLHSFSEYFFMCFSAGSRCMLKGIVHQKIRIVSLFAHPHAYKLTLSMFIALTVKVVLDPVDFCPGQKQFI